MSLDVLCYSVDCIYSKLQKIELVRIVNDRAQRFEEPSRYCCLDSSEAEHLLLLAKDIFTCFHETLYLKLTYLYLVNVFFLVRKSNR